MDGMVVLWEKAKLFFSECDEYLEESVRRLTLNVRGLLDGSYKKMCQNP